MKIRKSTLYVVLIIFVAVSAGATFYLLRAKPPTASNEVKPLTPPRSASQFLNSLPKGEEAKSSMYTWTDEQIPPSPTSRYEIPE